MQRTIYIDSIFAVNMIMNYMLLVLTAKMLKQSTTFFRLLLGSAVGAIGYCLVICLPFFSYGLKPALMMLLTALFMIKIGCGIKGVKRLFYAMGYLFTYAFLLGGFLLFLLKRIPFLRENADSIFVIASVGCLGFGLCIKGIRKKKRQDENYFCTVKLYGDEEPFCVCALVDTGNGLIEPVSGKPVAILEAGIWQRMNHAKRPEKFRIIPFHSIGKMRGMLEGYEVEKIEIKYEMTEKELSDVIIAVFQGALSEKGDYQMILPPGWSL